MMREVAMGVVDFVIAIGWIAFWIYWLYASQDVKSGESGPGWRRAIGVRVVIAVAVIFLLRIKFFRHHGLTHNPWLEGIGLAVWVLGLGLAIWARLYLGRNWGMPMTRKDDPELVTTGPYSRVRHPIYTGIILGTIGTAIAVSIYWLAAVVILSGYFVFSAIREERNMAGTFPDTYPAYKRSTKMLIPFVV
jgi:protein-S-isoprenylcysteine O-methyltransferase Ste14